MFLLASSAVYSYGLSEIRRGDNRRLTIACVVTAGLGGAFLVLKLIEWKLDLDDRLFSGPSFALTGVDSGGAQLFWCFYFVATGLQAVHMAVGIGLVLWIAFGARMRRFSGLYRAPAEIIGLYWSFVDMVWLCLFPMIYLVAA